MIRYHDLPRPTTKLVPYAEVIAEYQRTPHPQYDPAEVEKANRLYAELLAWNGGVHEPPDIPRQAHAPRPCLGLVRRPARPRCSHRRPTARRRCANRHAERGDPDPVRRVRPALALVRARALLELHTGPEPAAEIVAAVAHQLIDGLDVDQLEVLAVAVEVALRRMRGGGQ